MIIKAITLIAICLLAVFIFSQKTLAFDPFRPTCQGTGSSTSCNPCQGLGGDSTTCKQSKTQAGSSTDPTLVLIKTVTNLLAIVAGIVAVVFLILGGLAFITANGSQEQIATARRRIIGAAIGAVIVALAWTITTFVVDHFIQ